MFTDRIFELADKLDHFKKPLESNLEEHREDVGDKTFRWEDADAKAQITFNFSTDPSAKALWDCFESMTDSQRAFLELKRTVRHDKLGCERRAE